MIDTTGLIGQPYTKEHDCNWLASVMARRAHGLDAAGAGGEWFRKVVLDHYRPTDKAEPGVLSIYEIPVSGRVAWHCGTVVRPGWMITTTQATGVILVRLKSVMWKILFKGYHEYSPKN